MKTRYIICEMDVGTFEDIQHKPGYETLVEAERVLQELKDNPQCEIPFYIKEFTQPEEVTLGR
jgi:hypothetical protein